METNNRLGRPVSQTRFIGLGYANICRGLWVYVDMSDGPQGYAQVGPHYPSKAELLADLRTYAHDAGWDRA